MDEKLFVLLTLKNSGLSKAKSLHTVCNTFLEDFFFNIEKLMSNIMYFVVELVQINAAEGI